MGARVRVEGARVRERILAAGLLTILAGASCVATGYGLAFADRTDSGKPAATIRTAVRFRPTAVHFGTVSAGTTSAPTTITFINGGPAPVTVSTAAATPPFNVTANTCSTIEPHGGTCSIAVEFAPVLHGKFKGMLEVVYETARAKQRVKLSGNAK